LPLGEVPQGLQRFSVRIIDKDRSSYFESTPIRTSPIVLVPPVQVAPPANTAASTVVESRSIEGFLDLVDNQRIAGWAWDKSHPDALVQVEIYDGSKLIATVPAGVFRQDLRDAQKGTGAHAFTYPNPFSNPGGAHTIRVLASGRELTGSPK